MRFVIEYIMPQVLTELECQMPAWELDINRHNVLHLTEAVRQNGSC